MALLHFIHSLFLKNRPPNQGAVILPMKEQIKAWRRAGKRMGWSIDDNEFEVLEEYFLPYLTDNDRRQGIIGSVLFYGFGDDGRGNSDAVLLDARLL